MFKRWSSSKPSPNPDGVLHAISLFEDGLHPLRRLQYQSLKYQTRQKPPTIREVYNVCAEIDRGLATIYNGRRAFGLHLIPLLQSVQQLAIWKKELGPAHDGSVGPFRIADQACDIWTIVKFCMQSVYRQEHFWRIHCDEITKLLLEIGRSAPLYPCFTIYYPDFANLGTYTFRYYILIVNLCRDIYGSIFPALSPLENSTQSSFTASKYSAEEFVFYARKIEQDVAALDAKDQQYWSLGVVGHSQSHGSLAKLELAGWKRRKKRRRQASKDQMLKAASMLDYQAQWKYVRTQATTVSFMEESNYIEWKRSTTSATLICPGAPGVGKSVTLANMVDDLRYLDANNVVVHFFCAFDDLRTLQSRSIIGSFVRQILDAFPVEAFVFHKYDGNYHDARWLIEFFKWLLPRADVQRIFFVLDGLHACSDHDRSQVIEYLRVLQLKLPLLICISTMDDGGQDPVLTSLKAVSTLSVSVSQAELQEFIKQELLYCQRVSQLSTTSTHYQQSIIDYTSCNLETNYPLARQWLLRYSREPDFVRDLRSTESLGDPLQLLSRIGQGDEPSTYLSFTLLEIMAVAIEPLTLDQLRDAMSLSTDTRKSDSEPASSGPHLQPISTMIPITVDEERLTAHIAHHCSFQYLTTKREGCKEVDLNLAHQRMACICLRCLTRPESKPSANHKDIKRKSISSELSCNTKDKDSWSIDSRTTIAGSRLSSESNTSTIQADTSNDVELAFQTYASKYWLQHFTHVAEDDIPTIDLARALLLAEPFQLQYPNSSNQTIIEWCWTHNHTVLLKLLLNNGYHEQAHPILTSAANDNDTKTIRELTALYPFNLDKIYHDNHSLTDILLAAHTDSALTTPRTFGAADPCVRHRSPLWHAARNGDVDRVKAILSSAEIPGVDSAGVNDFDVNDMTPLAIAVMYDRVEVVRVLLTVKTINTRVLNDDLRTPLQVAEQYGFREIAQMLRAFEERNYVGGFGLSGR